MSNHEITQYLKNAIQKMENHTMDPARLRQYTIFVAQQKRQDFQDLRDLKLLLKYLFLGYYISNLLESPSH